MQKLLSLPPNLVSAFYELENVDRTEWFCTSDPVGMKLGSGGGTTWLLREWYRNQQTEHSTEKRILLHAGGQSRRLPEDAPSGKCSLRKDINPNTGISLGTRAEAGAKLIILASSTL